MAPSESLTVALCYRADLLLVRICVSSGRYSISRWLAIGVSRMGNGFIYLGLAVILIVSSGSYSIILIGTSALNAGLLHSFYPFMKKRVGRFRPYRSHPDLAPLLGPLDEHSFPSGHAMTLTGVLVPIVLAFPGSLLASVVLWGIMAWARLASAHHYPSDVVGGTVLGLFISYPVSRVCLAFGNAVV